MAIRQVERWGHTKCVRLLAHPRTSAMAEVAYATHGLHGGWAHGPSWVTIAVYAAILLVSIVHLVWAHMEGL